MKYAKIPNATLEAKEALHKAIEAESAQATLRERIVRKQLTDLAKGR